MYILVEIFSILNVILELLFHNLIEGSAILDNPFGPVQIKKI